MCSLVLTAWSVMEAALIEQQQALLALSKLA